MKKIATLLYILCALSLPAVCFAESFVQLSSGIQPVVMAEVGSMPYSNLPSAFNHSRGTRQITKQAGSNNITSSVSYGGTYSASPLSRKKGVTAASLSGGGGMGGCTTAMVGGHSGPTTTFDAPAGGSAPSIQNISKAARPDSGNTGNVPLTETTTVMAILALLYAAVCFIRSRKHSAKA